jgi:hypothetical protein
MTKTLIQIQDQFIASMLACKNINKARRIHTTTRLALTTKGYTTEEANQIIADAKDIVALERRAATTKRVADAVARVDAILTA